MQWSLSGRVWTLGVSTKVEKHFERLGTIGGGGGVAWRATLLVRDIDLGPCAKQHIGRLSGV